MLIKVAKRIFGAEHVHVDVDVHGEAEQHGRGGEGRGAEGACTREEEGEAGACVS